MSGVTYDDQNHVVGEQQQFTSPAAAATTTTTTTTVAEVADDNDVEELDPIPKLRSEIMAAEKEEDKHKYTFDDGFVVDYRVEPKIEQITSEVDPEDGYRPITWKELERIFCYERVAKGFKVCGDISQKHREHWERSKQIRVRDAEGNEAALFFYDDNAPEPHFSWSDVEIGNYIEIKDPRLHKFMDGQDGMRVEYHKSIGKVVKNRFTDDKRLEYGVLNKNNGNKQFELAVKAKAKEEEDERIAKEKGVPYKKLSQHMPNSAAKLFDSALTFYDMAITHLERSLFVDGDASTAADREKKRQTGREALAACFLNIAASQILQKNWTAVEGPCEKALAVNASKALNAKAYFRWGHALLEQGHMRMAEDKLKRADQLNPNDGKILELLHRIAVIRYEEQKNEKEIFQLRQRKRQNKEEGELAAQAEKPASPSSTADGQSPAANVNASAASSKLNPNFGIRRSLFGPPQAVLKGVSNFRDLGAYPCNDNKTVTKRFMLYRSSNLFDLTTGAEGETSNDLRVLTEELGIKTVIDLRNQREIDMFRTEAARVRSEGGLRMLLKKQKEASGNAAPAEEEAKKEESGSDVDVSADSETDEEEDAKARTRRREERDRRRKAKREEKAAAKAARKKALEVIPITGPFVDYNDYFTNIKVICAPKKKERTPSPSENATFMSPTSASPSSAPPLIANGTANNSNTSAASGSALASLKRFFLFLSSGGTRPSIVDTDAVLLSRQTENRVWYRLTSRQRLVACPKLEPPADVGADGKPLPTSKKYKSADDEISFAFANRRTVLHIDVVTRAFVNAVSVWVLLGVAFYFITFQLKAASKFISKHVVDKGPSYMYQIMVDNQGPEIAQIFALAADESNYPILITCALGKDRTGVIIALLLAASDVKFEAIAKDYAQLTNDSLLASPEGKYLVEQQREMGVVGKDWDTANAADIKKLFLHLKESYGGVHAYLSKIGVTVDQIQSIRRILTRPTTS